LETLPHFVLEVAPRPYSGKRAEICEHKSLGHPDTLCDGVAEAVSRKLCAAYLAAYGTIRHHNVDKALLVGGQSRVRFGGGEISAGIRLIVAGRADPLPQKNAISDLVVEAASAYLAHAVGPAARLFRIEAAVREGSPNLRHLFAGTSAIARANDTSFGVGFAPYSRLEQAVLQLAERLRSQEFRTAFPAAGADFKVMGARQDERLEFTVALALVSREIQDTGHYFGIKEKMTAWLTAGLPQPGLININTLDDPSARDEAGIYLTVTGLSAEHGDDGQVGRGNRVSGLITPSRPTSLEAAAGKNPVSHVGKIYNVLAMRMAADLVARVPGFDEASVQMLSAIGQPIDRPKLILVEAATASGGPISPAARRAAEDVVRSRLERIQDLCGQLARGELQVY
jgi:S-adenosylmethionine synthetase